MAITLPEPTRDCHASIFAVVPCEGRCPSRSPGYFHKEIVLCYTAITVQPGTAMTVKEMRPARQLAGRCHSWIRNGFSSV